MWPSEMVVQVLKVFRVWITWGDFRCWLNFESASIVRERVVKPFDLPPNSHPVRGVVVLLLNLVEDTGYININYFEYISSILHSNSSHKTIWCITSFRYWIKLLCCAKYLGFTGGLRDSGLSRLFLLSLHQFWILK